jgi:hypothetical protein
MSTFEDVKRLGLTLPDTVASDVGVSVRCGSKERGFAWVWQERTDPKKARVPCFDVVAIRTVNVEEKAMLIAADPVKFFTEPHYNGYPAVLVRLAKIELDELEELLEDGWRVMAPKSVVKAYDADKLE